MSDRREWIGPGRVMRRALPLLLFGLVAWAFSSVGLSVQAIIQGIGPIGRLLGQLFPPDLSPDFVGSLGAPILETLSLSVAAMGLAVLFGLPLAVAGTETLWRGTSVQDEPDSWQGRFGYHASRRLLDVARAVPDLAWALVFVAMVGLGAVPALLACGIAYTGLLGKGWSEIFESVDPRPAASMRALGAQPLAVMSFAILPQAWPQVISYLFYCWECSMRASALMGFVGAGGLGYQIDLSMRMFEFHQVSTLLGVLLLLIALVDATSWVVRLWVQSEPAIGFRRLKRWFGRIFGLSAGLLAIAGTWSFRDSWSDLVSPAGVGRLGRFLSRCWPPQVGSYAQSLLPRLYETLAISVAATAIGALFGLLLCFTATRARALALEGDFRASWLRSVAYLASRAILNLLRSIPEVLWALLMVVVVGLGPLAGSLALGVHSAGVLGKLYAEALEEADFSPVQALAALGAPSVASLWYAAVPIALPVLASYTLLRWEINLRVATILGFVGGGGLGQELWNQIQLGFYDRIVTIVGMIFLVVVAGDRLSGATRRLLAH